MTNPTPTRPEPTTPTREELLDERNKLLNAFGGSPWRDGIIAKAIKDIDQRLAGKERHNV